jgi:hypothetical protein
VSCHEILRYDHTDIDEQNSCFQDFVPKHLFPNISTPTNASRLRAREEARPA